MKRLFFSCIICLGILNPLHLYSQDCGANADSLKSSYMLAQLDSVINNIIQLQRDCVLSDIPLQLNIDTIIIKLSGFKMAVRRRDTSVLQYDQDFKYYKDETAFLSKLTSADSINALVEDLKEDMLIKSFHSIDTASISGPGGPDESYHMVNLKVRVRSGSDRVLHGFEVYIKRGIYIPSRDSVRIPELTDNAVIPIAPGRFTVVVHNGNLSGTTQLVLTLKSDPICDVKLN